MNIFGLFRRKANYARDPICHMKVDKTNPRATSNYKNSVYYFCAPGCKNVFDSDPLKFLESDAPTVKM